MQKPKLTTEKLARFVATGEADEYLTAHSESAAVYPPESKTPRYDVILDPEASDELYRAFKGGKGNLQTATPEELQAFVNAMADRQEEQDDQDDQEEYYCEKHAGQRAWKRAFIRCCIAVASIFLLCVVMMLFLVYSSK